MKCLPNLAGFAWTNTTLLTNPLAPGRFAVPREIIVDDAGNAYTIGRFNQYTGDIDQFILSVGASGARWLEVFNPAHEVDFDKGISLLRAGNGNIFTIGHSDHYSPNGSSIIARQFTANGALLWASNYLAPANGNFYAFSETPTSAVLDSQWNLIIGGGRIQGFDRGYLTLKIDPAGRVIWRAVLNHFENNFAATDISVDLDDNILVTGPAGTVKYSPDADLLWYSPEHGDIVEVVYESRIVLSGSVRNGEGRQFVNTTELNPNGTVRWQARYEETSGIDAAFSRLFMDIDGSIYVAINSSDGSSNQWATVLKYSEPPQLSATLVNGSQLKVSWFGDDTNLVLTSASVVDGAVWTRVTNVPVQEGSKRSVMLPRNTTNKFFRLEHR
jgi:hypothetical protein